jgi:hypothetical protein
MTIAQYDTQECAFALHRLGLWSELERRGIDTGCCSRVFGEEEGVRTFGDLWPVVKEETIKGMKEVGLATA